MFCLHYFCLLFFCGLVLPLLPVFCCLCVVFFLAFWVSRCNARILIWLLCVFVLFWAKSWQIVVIVFVLLLAPNFRLILGTRLLVFCGLLDPFPLSFVCLRIESSISWRCSCLVCLFCWFLRSVWCAIFTNILCFFLFLCVRKTRASLPRAPYFSPHTLPPVPIHSSAHIDPNAVPKNLCHVTPVPLRCHSLLLFFMAMTYTTENVPLFPPPGSPSDLFCAASALRDPTASFRAHARISVSLCVLSHMSACLNAFVGQYTY